MIGVVRSVLRKVPALAWVAAGLLVASGWQAFQHNLTKGRLADCQLETIGFRRSLDMANAELADLERHLAHQNERVRAYQLKSVERRRRIAEVEAELERNRAGAREALLRLTSRSGESCEEGVELIDEELGL